MCCMILVNSPFHRRISVLPGTLTRTAPTSQKPISTELQIFSNEMYL